MRRCIRSILLSVTLLAVLSSTANACFFFPLFDPLNWCVGHHNPYATYRVIDDWLGYGYLRGQQNGSLGHYPGRPWNCYTPMYPQLSRPWHGPQPYVAPLAMPLPHPMMMPTAPMYSAPMPTAPYVAQQWNVAPGADDCGCGTGAPAMPSYSVPGLPTPHFAPHQPMPWTGDSCDCGTVAAQPMPVQVPVTTYRPVTIDRGHFQMIWVPRPVTHMVPQMSWQTRYMQQPQMQYMPAMPAMPMESPCGDTPCGDGSGMPISSAVPNPSLTGYYAPAQSPHLGMSARIPVRPNSTLSAYRQGYGSALLGGLIPNPATPQQYAYRPPYATPVPIHPPHVAAVPNYGSAYAGYPQSMTPAYAAQQMNSPYWPSAAPMTAYTGTGDVWGDHESSYVAPSSVGNTAMIPVMPNSFQGGVPVRRAPLTTPLRSASSRKYPNSVW